MPLQRQRLALQAQMSDRVEASYAVPVQWGHACEMAEGMMAEPMQRQRLSLQAQTPDHVEANLAVPVQWGQDCIDPSLVRELEKIERAETARMRINPSSSDVISVCRS